MWRHTVEVHDWKNARKKEKIEGLSREVPKNIIKPCHHNIRATMQEGSSWASIVFPRSYQA